MSVISISDETDLKTELKIQCTHARILMQNGFKNVKVYPAGTRFYQAMHYRDYKNDITDNSIESSGGSNMANETKEVNSVSTATNQSADISMRLDCSGMQCPGPLLKVFEGMQGLNDGQVLEVRASDPGFTKDVAAWCKRTGNTLLYNEKEGTDYVARIFKGQSSAVSPSQTGSSVPSALQSDKDGKTIIVF